MNERLRMNERQQTLLKILKNETQQRQRMIERQRMVERQRTLLGMRHSKTSKDSKMLFVERLHSLKDSNTLKDS